MPELEAFRRLIHRALSEVDLSCLGLDEDDCTDDDQREKDGDTHADTLLPCNRRFHRRHAYCSLTSS
jgi:hypothetical protein